MYVFGQVLKLIDFSGYDPELAKDDRDSYMFKRAATIVQNGIILYFPVNLT
jgi:hypothetical protein